MLTDTGSTALQALFAPRSVAVVGASPDLAKPGGRALAFVTKFGYRGPVYPINPRYQEIAGLRCYPDFKALPEPADMVILLVPGPAIPDYVRAAGAAGSRAAVICSSGFAEAGPEGVALQARLAEAAREAGVAVLGPNCLGMVDLHSGVAATFSTAFDAEVGAKAGPIAFISQSGAMGAAVFCIAQAEGIGFGKFLSTGNEAVLDFNDFLEYLAEDDGLSLILGYMEGIRDGRRFVAAARRAREAGKTVAVLKVGKSDAGQRAAQSHTGALVGSVHVFDAAFRRAGVLAVDDVRGLIDLGAVLPARWPAKGPRVGIVSASGGAGVMLSDRCTASGLVVPSLTPETVAKLAKVLPPIVGMANPVDYGPIYGDLDMVKTCVELLALDPNIDIVMFFLGLAPGMAGQIEPRLAAVQEASGKPVIATWLGGPPHGTASMRAHGVPAFDDISRSVAAAALFARASQPLPQVAGPASGKAAATRKALQDIAATGRTALSEREVKALVAAYGVPVTPEALATTADEAVAAVKRFGRPCAVKAEAPALLHKSDAGAVRLKVGPQDAADAFGAVVVAAAKAVGTAGVQGAVVQPMAAPGLELLVGLRHDPQFGPTITVGLGGTASEVMADVTTELAPVDLPLARAMLDRLRGARLLGPFRGAPARDREAVARLLVGLSAFAVDAGAMVDELDLNPVIVHAEGEGCTAVDGAAVIAPEPPGRNG